VCRLFGLTGAPSAPCDILAARGAEPGGAEPPTAGRSRSRLSRTGNSPLLFSHNGVIGNLPKLKAELGDYRDLIRGDNRPGP
jgi:predicted glutamine amidotransferase